MYIDEEESFKKALGANKYKNLWLLKPSVMAKMVGYVRKFGQFPGDALAPETQMLGGTFIVVRGEVIYVHLETSSFDNGSAREMLAAITGKPLADTPATPVQEDVVCTREVK